MKVEKCIQLLHGKRILQITADITIVECFILPIFTEVLYFL